MYKNFFYLSGFSLSSSSHLRAIFGVRWEKGKIGGVLFHCFTVSRFHGFTVSQTTENGNRNRNGINNEVNNNDEIYFREVIGNGSGNGNGNRNGKGNGNGELSGSGSSLSAGTFLSGVSESDTNPSVSKTHGLSA